MGADVKTLLLGAVALIAVGASAGAADIPLKAAAPIAPYDWTGFYGGFHAGWETADTAGFTNNNIASDFGNPLFALTDDSVTDQTMRGWLAGGQFGYNHQFGRAVVGLEFSGSWSKLSNQSAGTVLGALTPGFNNQTPLGCSQLVNVATAPPASLNTTLSCSAKVDWTVQALTRLGYTFADGRLLPYVEGGVALTHLSINTSINFSESVQGQNVTESDVFGKSSELVGIVLGGGAQYALGDGFSFGIEYLYAKYPTQDLSSIGSFNCMINSPPNCSPFVGAPPSLLHNVQENRDLTTNTIRAVLNYKFSN